METTGSGASSGCCSSSSDGEGLSGRKAESEGGRGVEVEWRPRMEGGRFGGAVRGRGGDWVCMGVRRVSIGEGVGDCGDGIFEMERVLGSVMVVYVQSTSRREEDLGGMVIAPDC